MARPARGVSLQEAREGQLLFDTHAHLGLPEFGEDGDGAVARARQVGIRYIIVVGCDLASSRRAVELANKYPGVVAAIGVHPHNAASFDAAAEGQLRDLARSPGVVAVGEIGLDYFRLRSPTEAQRRAFRAQLALAAEGDLPVIVHDRDAHQEVSAMLTEWAASSPPCTGPPRRTGVLHCFSGDWPMAQWAVRHGFYIGVAGPVTFVKAQQLKEVVREVPSDRLLLETDCPYLTPRPLRGRNEPANLWRIAEAVALVRGTSVKTIAHLTTENACRLFRLGQPDKAARSPTCLPRRRRARTTFAEEDTMAQRERGTFAYIVNP